MKIQYTQFALNPALRGTTTHLPPHSAQALIDSGAAVEVKMPARGTREWYAAMQELEAERVKNIPPDQRQTVSTIPVWNVRLIEGPPRRYVVVKSNLVGEYLYGETMLLDRGRPDIKASVKHFQKFLEAEGCPKSVIRQWLDCRNAPDYLRLSARFSRVCNGQLLPERLD